MPSTLFDVLKMLDRAGVRPTLQRSRPNAVCLLAIFGGELWEIEIFEDGHGEISRFSKDGTSTGGLGALAEHLRLQAIEEAKWQAVIRQEMQERLPPSPIRMEDYERAMQRDGAPPLFEVLKMLERARTQFVLETSGPDTVSVLAFFVGERWAITIFADDRVECVRYSGDESIEGELDLLVDRLAAASY